jgi:hypothetical protein
MKYPANHAQYQHHCKPWHHPVLLHPSAALAQAIVRLVVFCILLATAGAVTKLMAMNMEAARSVVWDNAAMDSMIRIRMQVGAGPATCMQAGRPVGRAVCGVCVQNRLRA